MSYKLDVYFDYVRVGNIVELGVVVDNEEEIIYSKLERLEGVEGNNFYFSLYAWYVAVETLRELFIEEGDIYDKVSFYNQNELIFKWVEEGRYKDDYEEVIEKIYRSVEDLLEDVNLGFSFIKVLGKSNKAKRLLNKRKKKIESTQMNKLSFGGLSRGDTKVKTGLGKSIKSEHGKGSPSNVVNLFDQIS